MTVFIVLDAQNCWGTGDIFAYQKFEDIQPDFEKRFVGKPYEAFGTSNGIIRDIFIKQSTKNPKMWYVCFGVEEDGNLTTGEEWYKNQEQMALRLDAIDSDYLIQEVEVL